MPPKPRAPRYLELAEEFRRQVKAGVLRPGDRLPSFTEMRARHGVCQATIERVHKSLDADGLIVRDRGRGTFVAHPKPRPRTGIIGLSGHGFAYAQSLNYSAQLMADFRPLLQQEKMQALLLDDDSGAGWEKVDGVLMYDWGPERTLRWLPEYTPCVSVLNAVEGISSVVADDFSGARDATRHLLEFGHRRIACLTTMGSTLTRQRLAGYRAALREAKVKPDARWLRRLRRPASELRWMSAGCDEMRSWLEADWKSLGCTALLVQNDEAAVGVLEALRAAKIMVPDEVSVIGFDGMEICDYVSPRLSTVEVPLREIGALGLQLLIEQIKQPKTEVAHHVLPVSLKVRESVSTPRR